MLKNMCMYIYTYIHTYIYIHTYLLVIDNWNGSKPSYPTARQLTCTEQRHSWQRGIHLQKQGRYHTYFPGTKATTSLPDIPKRSKKKKTLCAPKRQNSILNQGSWGVCNIKLKE